jgi:hypothetical protein
MEGKKEVGSVLGQKAAGVRTTEKENKKQKEASVFAQGTRNIKEIFSSAGRRAWEHRTRDYRG